MKRSFSYGSIAMLSIAFLALTLKISVAQDRDRQHGPLHGPGSSHNPIVDRPLHGPGSSHNPIVRHPVHGPGSSHNPIVCPAPYGCYGRPH